MSEKRRDHKGRILRDGESQRADLKYRFAYTDISGKRKEVTSWRLDDADPTPANKRKGPSLREMERQIEKDKYNHILSNGGEYTVLTLAEKYISLKTGVRINTETGYKTVINLIKNDPFGSRRIDTIRISDAKAWLIKLQREDGKGYSTIHTVRGVLRPAFQMAEDDDLIRKNPFQFPLSTVIINDSVTREAITEKQQIDYLDFIKQDKTYSKYYEAIFILFNTGLRISEFCGLTISDIDFEKNRIKVDHQLIRASNMKYVIQAPKTEKGIRYVPMTIEVADCFRRIIKRRKRVKTEPVIGGRVGFLFLDKNSRPTVAQHWEKYMQRIREKYNNDINHLPLPIITPHICRHTFCTNMAKNGMNPKMLQYIMGHADISVTLNTYTHVQFEDAEKEMMRLFGNG